MEMRNINQQLSHLSNQNDKRQTIIRDLEKHVLHRQSKIDDLTIELSNLKLQNDNLESRMQKLEKKELQKHRKFLKDELDYKKKFFRQYKLLTLLFNLFPSRCETILLF
jgi:chromosome segregation ATPase